MDCIAQAAEYLKPSVEFFAKISAIIPLWMIAVIADKHLLGLPLLEGSMWRSPRIPPRITIKPNHEEEKPSRFKTDQHSATGSPSPSRHGEEAPLSESVRPSEPSSSSPFGPGFSDIATEIGQPNQEFAFISQYPSLGASTTTALSIHTPLGMHDPLFAWTAWDESTYVCAAIMLLAAMLFLGIINIGRSLCTSQASQPSTHRQTKDVGTQFPDATAYPHLVLEIPAYWEFIPSAAAPLDSETTSQDKKIDDTKADVPVIGAKEEESGQGGDHLAGEVEEKEDKEERKEERIQDGKIEDAGTADFTVVGTKEEDRGQDRDQLRSEAGDGGSKEESEERGNVDREDEGKETANNSGDDGVDGSQVVGGQPKKKKKRRVRGNAKQRAAKRALAAESSNATGEASNDLDEDQKQSGQEEGTTKLLESEVAEPGASDVLAMSQAKGKDKAPVEDPETVGKEGSYSLKQTDLLDAAFVATDPAKKPSLPPRPPTPEANEYRVPVGLPQKPLFTGLPTQKSPPVATAKPAQPKREVPPLLPHHQSFGVAQRAPAPPIFRNLPTQGVPMAGTHPGSPSNFNGASFFGVPPPNGPMYHFGGGRGGAGR